MQTYMKKEMHSDNGSENRSKIEMNNRLTRKVYNEKRTDLRRYYRKT